MSAEENKALVQRFYEAVNSRNLDLLDEICAPDFRAFINDVTGESVVDPKNWTVKGAN